MSSEPIDALLPILLSEVATVEVEASVAEVSPAGGGTGAGGGEGGEALVAGAGVFVAPEGTPEGVAVAAVVLPDRELVSIAGAVPWLEQAALKRVTEETKETRFRMKVSGRCLEHKMAARAGVPIAAETRGKPSRSRPFAVRSIDVVNATVPHEPRSLVSARVSAPLRRLFMKNFYGAGTAGLSDRGGRGEAPWS